MTDTIHRTDRDRVAVLSIDCPERSMNVVDERVLSDLDRHVRAIQADDDIDAIVLTSEKPGSFGAGADIEWLPELAAREDAEDFLAGVHALMLRICNGRAPMVAALNGPAFGGALELALAGHAIVAVDGMSVGLPEVGLGLLPGGGGTQMLLRWVPLARALTMLTDGRPVAVERALEDGLVARVVDSAELLEEAVTMARELAEAGHTAWRIREGEARAETLDAIRVELAAGRRGLSTARAAILDVVRVGVVEGVDAGLAAERGVFLRLLRSPEARAALHLFRVEADVKRRSRGSGTEVERLAVVGGGQMGSGIAATAVSRGVTATVRDVSDDAIDRARAYRDKVLDRVGEGASDPRAKLWQGTTSWQGFAEADAVIEAVFELHELKVKVLAEISGQVDEDALVATNTSAISIASLAPSIERPERFLGMHFFSPVDRMPLVELVPHTATSSRTRARAAFLGRQLGKVPVIVGDAPGFFTSRVYARWLIEGMRLVLDGAAVHQVDTAARAAGFPVGPLQAHDEATLELVMQASITQVAENVMADRLEVPAVRAALERLIAAGVAGRRHGRGFYDYQEGRRVGANDQVHALLDSAPVELSDDQVGERLLLAFATECFLCWDDGTLCHPDDGDVAAVLGIGFPRTLGGPFHWADELGATDIRDRCAALGPAFTPGATIHRLAEEGGRFRDAGRRPTPFQTVEAPS